MSVMSVDDVVAKFSSQPGLRLLTYREVGLPLWDMPIRCRLLGKKGLQALDEFVLRCLDADLRTDSSIADLLGVSPRVIQTVMGRLLSTGYIVPVRGTQMTADFTLSDRGRQVLAEASEVVAEEKTLNIAYDGLLHSFSLVDQTLRWRPRDLRENGILEIPAFPADPPDVGPSSTAAIGRVTSGVKGLEDHELLSVLGVEGKREKFFIRAVALVLETADSARDITIQFAIDGRSSKNHDIEFARAEGQRKLGIVESLRGGGIAGADAVLAPEVLAQREDSREIVQLRRATETLRGRLGDLQRESAELPDRQAGKATSAVQGLEELQVRLDKAEASLARVPVRMLEVHEHAGLLAEALRSAQDRLLIVSPWLRAAVIDDNFIAALRQLLSRGVEVRIAYGIEDGKVGSEKDLSVEEALRELSDANSNLHFVRLGDTHAKVLVVDDRFVVATSFNWLSFKGDPRRPFRDERGTYVTVVSEIERIYNDYATRMSAIEAKPKNA